MSAGATSIFGSEAYNEYSVVGGAARWASLIRSSGQSIKHDTFRTNRQPVTIAWRLRAAAKNAPQAMPT